MLTRIEIDGFKTFSQFSLDVDPFMAILGPNAAGKSNLFDALRLLCRLAEHNLHEAVQGLRGEPLELFHRGSDGSPGTRMSITAEVLLHPHAKDPWQTPVEVSHTRIRYQVTVERRADEKGIERLVVMHERAEPILRQNDTWDHRRSAFDQSFAKHFLKYGRREPWLETKDSTPPASRFARTVALVVIVLQMPRRLPSSRVLRAPNSPTCTPSAKSFALGVSSISIQQACEKQVTSWHPTDWNLRARTLGPFWRTSKPKLPPRNAPVERSLILRRT